MLVYHLVMASRKPIKSNKPTLRQSPTDPSSTIDAGGGSEELYRYVGANGMPDIRGLTGKQWYDYPDPYKPRKPVRPPVITRYIPPAVPVTQGPPKKPVTPKKPKTKNGKSGGGGSEDQGVL